MLIAIKQRLIGTGKEILHFVQNDREDISININDFIS